MTGPGRKSGRPGRGGGRSLRLIGAVAVAAAALLAVDLGVAACTASPPGSGPTATQPQGGDIPGPDETGPRTPTPPPPEPTSAAEVRERADPVPYGGPTVYVLDAAQPIEVTVDSVGPGDELWTWTPDPAAPDLRLALLAAPEGSAFDVRPDGSVLLPEPPDRRPTVGIAPLAPGTFTVLAPDLIELHARATRPGEPVVAWFDEIAVESATWGENEGGRSLAVVPTAWARRGGEAGVELVWRHVQWYAADEATPAMYDQLVCHTVGAPDKASWNLEPWRPDVGLLATMAAQCNPT